jgi:hypothetical protein
VTRWLREPVVHFVALGTVVFAIYAILQEPQPPHRLTVDDAPIEQLRADWAARNRAPPNEADEHRLKKDWLEEEVLYERARELALGENDTVVRRRLVQRMRFLIEDTTPIREPDDLQLRAWIDAHRERYVEPARVSFEHVFFSRSQRGAHLERDAVNTTTALRVDPDQEVAGDPFPRSNRLENASPATIARAFGAAFAEEISRLGVGVWHGPIASSYGLHVVRVTAREESMLPTLETARDRARADWVYEERQRLNREAVDAIIQRYSGRGPATR